MICFNEPSEIYLYKALHSSVSLSRFVCPWGQTFLLHRRGGQTFVVHRREGGQTFYVGGSGGYDDVDGEMDISKPNFLVREVNIFVRKASKLSPGARIFRGP